MQPIEYSLELERLLAYYQFRRNRIKAFAIEITGLTTYEIALHFNCNQSTAHRSLY